MNTEITPVPERTGHRHTPSENPVREPELRILWWGCRDKTLNKQSVLSNEHYAMK